MEMIDKIIYQNDNYKIQAKIFDGSSSCFITFGSYTDDFCLDREGYGESFFIKNKISAIHIINRDNVWYNYDDFYLALDLIKKYLINGQSIFTYGSSMGGYGAIKFAEYLGARIAIAISPQYHISPKIIKFDDRWKSVVKKNKLLWKTDYHTSESIQPIVFYDPVDLDALHFSMIKKYYPRSIGISIHHAGHPAGAYLEETNTLKSILKDIIQDKFDGVNTKKVLRQRKHLSAHYHFILARRLSDHHIKTKRKLIEIAISNRQEPVFYLYSALLEERDKLLLLAEQKFLKTIDCVPKNINMLRSYAFYLYRTNKLERAYSISKKMLNDSNFSETLYFHIFLCIRLKKYNEADSLMTNIIYQNIFHLIYPKYLVLYFMRQYFKWYGRKKYRFEEQFKLINESHLRIDHLNRRKKYNKNHVEKG